MARPTDKFELTEKDRHFLEEFLGKDENSSREFKRAKVLIELSNGLSVREVAESSGVSQPTVYRLRSIYKKDGLLFALKDQPRSGRPQQLTIDERQKIIDLTKTDRPEGKKKWTLRLLAKKAGELGLVNKGSISHTEVARILKEEGIKLSET